MRRNWLRCCEEPARIPELENWRTSVIKPVQGCMENLLLEILDEIKRNTSSNFACGDCFAVPVVITEFMVPPKIVVLFQLPA